MLISPMIREKYVLRLVSNSDMNAEEAQFVLGDADTGPTQG